MSDNRPVGALAWLPTPPADFSRRVRALLDSPTGLGHQLRALATFDLDENQLNKLASLLAKARKSGHNLSPLLRVRLGVLSNSTLDFILPVLVATALRHGIALECVVAGYGQIMQEALSPSSTINTAKLDLVLLANDYRDFSWSCRHGDKAAAEDCVTAVMTQLAAIRNGLHANGLPVLYCSKHCRTRRGPIRKSGPIITRSAARPHW